MGNITIGIEGLVGAGKTSICRELLDLIPNSIILHGGNLYRGIVYAISNSGINLKQIMQNKDEMHHLDIKQLMEKLQVELKIEDRESVVYIAGRKIDEDTVSDDIISYLKDAKPDIVIITGHDAYMKKKGDKKDLRNYKNSLNFVKAVKNARKYESSHEKLIIIAGACQSNYEELIKAGSNFASSPKRVNIHALDPAIIACNIALTEKSKEINLIELLEKTKNGEMGMGGIICNGMMYVGYPR